MNNIIKRTWKQNGMVQIEDLRGQTFQNESGGHTFVIRGEDEDGNQIALSGSPAGVFLRPDNTDQALTCSISDGMVYATLPAACYDVPGRAGITIYLTSNGQKTALYAAMVSVGRTSTGTVAPGTTADVVDLINRINEVVATIPPDYSALKNALNAFSVSEEYTDRSVFDCVYDEDISVSSETILHPLSMKIANGDTVKIFITTQDATSILSYASVILYEGSSYTSAHDEKRLDSFNNGAGISNGINQGLMTVSGSRAYIRFANFVSAGTISVHVTVCICNHIGKKIGRDEYHSDLINKINSDLYNKYYDSELAVSGETVLYPLSKKIPGGVEVVVGIYISDISVMIMNASPSIILYQGNSYTTPHDEKYLYSFNGGIGFANGWNYAKITTTGDRGYIRFANFVPSGTVSVKVIICGGETKNESIYVPINAFGDILPSQFKTKLEAFENDLLIACAGDSITAFVDTCDPQEDPSHCPPGQQYKDWVAQVQEYVNKAKPDYDRLDTQLFTKTGTWSSGVPGNEDPVTMQAEASASAFTFYSSDSNAKVEFTFDASKYDKCNIVYSIEPDGVLTKIVISEGNGKLLVSTDRSTWSEANGFSLNQRSNLEGYTEQGLENLGIPTRERHRRIWMKKANGVTGNISVSYQRDNTTPYDNSKMYMWGVERYSGNTIIFDNVGRGGRQTYYQVKFSRNITDRNPDLILFEMPIINETRYNLIQQEDAYNDFLKRNDKPNSLDTLTNDYANCPLVFFVPHGRGGYFDDDNRAIRWEPGNDTDQPAGQPPAYIFFMKTYQIVKGWFSNNQNVACFNMFNRLYDESLAEFGLYKRAFSTSGECFASDGTHLSQRGANVYTKYIAGLFTQY